MLPAEELPAKKTICNQPRHSFTRYLNLQSVCHYKWKSLEKDLKDLRWVFSPVSWIWWRDDLRPEPHLWPLPPWPLSLLQPCGKLEIHTTHHPPPMTRRRASQTSHWRRYRMDAIDAFVTMAGCCWCWCYQRCWLLPVPAVAAAASVVPSGIVNETRSASEWHALLTIYLWIQRMTLRMSKQAIYEGTRATRAHCNKADLLSDDMLTVVCHPEMMIWWHQYLLS